MGAFCLSKRVNICAWRFIVAELLTDFLNGNTDKEEEYFHDHISYDGARR